MNNTVLVTSEQPISPIFDRLFVGKGIESDSHNAQITRWRIINKLKHGTTPDDPEVIKEWIYLRVWELLFHYCGTGDTEWKWEYRLSSIVTEISSYGRPRFSLILD